MRCNTIFATEVRFQREPPRLLWVGPFMLPGEATIKELHGILFSSPLIFWTFCADIEEYEAVALKMHQESTNIKNVLTHSRKILKQLVNSESDPEVGNIYKTIFYHCVFRLFVSYCVHANIISECDGDSAISGRSQVRDELRRDQVRFHLET